jgi:hypothetical protein
LFPFGIHHLVTTWNFLQASSNLCILSPDKSCVFPSPTRHRILGITCSLFLQLTDHLHPTFCTFPSYIDLHQVTPASIDPLSRSRFSAPSCVSFDPNETLDEDTRGKVLRPV